MIYLKFLPSNVWPNCQFLGAHFDEIEYLPSLVWTLKESASPTRWALHFQVEPQSLSNFIHLLPLSFPFTSRQITSPAPPTFHTMTWLNHGFPNIVNLIPPFFLHGTLHPIQKPYINPLPFNRPTPRPISCWNYWFVWLPGLKQFRFEMATLNSNFDLNPIHISCIKIHNKKYYNCLLKKYF